MGAARWTLLPAGYPKNAREKFENSLKLVPADKIAAKSVTDLGGKADTKVANANQSPAKTTTSR
jgi:hypothetical protein